MEKIDFKEPKNLSELIEQISARPAMFAGSYNFYLASAFVSGYVYARDQSICTKDFDVLKNFSFWLSDKLKKPPNWAWSVTIKDYYGNDEAAFENLPRLFSEFLARRK